MVDPYRMVLINIIAVLLVGLGLFTYKKYFPLKKINLFFLLILISLLPLISLLRQGTYESGDLTQNVYKAMSFYQSLSEGNLFPQWAGELNATYGYPLFIFIYPLPFYIISLFHFLGFSLISSVKLLMASTFILSGIGMYMWIKEDFGKLPAFVAAVFYLYAPYHLVDTHFRISIGELVSFSLIPFILLSITKYLQKNSQMWFIATTVTLSLLLLANQAIALVSFGFFVIYAIFIYYRQKNKSVKNLITLSVSFIFALALSAFYWIPVLAESQFTHQAIYSQTIGFVQIHELLYSPWRYGLLFQGPYGELSFIIGYVQLLVLFWVILLLKKNIFNTTEKSKIIFFLFLLVLMCLLMLPLSSPLWDNVTILRNFQFTYRLLLFVSLLTAVIAGIVATKINKKIVYLLCALVILQTILNWGNRGMIPVNDTYLKKTLPMSTMSVEGFQPAVPKWTNSSDPWAKVIPDQRLEILEGKAAIKEIKRTSTKHIYTINIERPTTFKENTWYFPGWTIVANNKIIPIDFENPQYPGIITFTLPKGEYHVVLEFKNTDIRTTAQQISLGAFVIFCSLIAILLFQQRKTRFFR